MDQIPSSLVTCLHSFGGQPNDFAIRSVKMFCRHPHVGCDEPVDGTSSTHSGIVRPGTPSQLPIHTGI